MDKKVTSKQGKSTPQKKKSLFQQQKKHSRDSPILSASYTQMSKIIQKKKKKQSPVSSKYARRINTSDFWEFMIFLFFEEKYPNADLCSFDLAHRVNYYVKPNNVKSDPFRSIWKGLENCKKHKKRFIFIPMTLVLKTMRHSNILMFDLNKNLLFRFEPYGAEVPIGHASYNNVLNQDIITNIVENPKNINYVKKYIEPIEICPSKGPQWLENYDLEEQYFIENTGGLCLVFTLWFVELMLKNPKKNPQKIIEYMNQKVDRHGIRASTKIRLYLDRIIEIYYEMMTVAPMANK